MSIQLLMTPLGHRPDRARVSLRENLNFPFRVPTSKTTGTMSSGSSSSFRIDPGDTYEVLSA